MDTLHTVMRGMQAERKSTPNHLTVFREFLAHLDKIQHKAPAKRAARPARTRPAKRKPLRRAK
jgi:nitrate reductase assembly molybdenum cofactor insertion protein NarJ